MRIRGYQVSEQGLPKSDEELLLASRNGDTAAFAELWELHRGAGIVAARNLAPGLEAEDLVSDAYLKIFALIKDGRGPHGAFRPYLYQVIKTVAADRLRSPERLNANLESVPDLHEAGPWEHNSFDLNAVTEAWETLSPRWQAALWYAEVEQLPPREAAKYLGVSANSASALVGRARTALQSAWVSAHANRELADSACRSIIDDLQRYQRGTLTARASREVAAHLETCGNCERVAAEFSTLNHKLGLVIASAVLGLSGAATLVQALLPEAASTMAATHLPAVTDAHAGAPSTASATGLGAGTSIGGISLVAFGVLAAAAVFTASALLSAPPAPNDAGEPLSSETHAQAETSHPAETSDATEPEAAQEDSSNDSADANSTEQAPTPLPADEATETITPPVTEPPAVEPPVTEPPIVKPPVIHPPSLDESLTAGFACFDSGIGYRGEANGAGSIQIRLTMPGNAPVELTKAATDTASTPPHAWRIAPLLPLAQWGKEIAWFEYSLLDIEVRLVSTGGNYSQWEEVKASGATAPFCSSSPLVSLEE